MEDKKLSEKESLELISQMIQSSKEGLEMGKGNLFLYWGYFTVALSMALYSLCYFTQNPQWSAGWMLMFVFWFATSYINRRSKPSVLTYTDKALSQVWRVIGYLFLVTFLAMGIFIYFYGKGSFVLMLPLSLMYAAIGTAITGIIIKETWITYPTLFAFMLGVYMLMDYTMEGVAQLIWYLYFGFAFAVMMILPGHILNTKAKKQA